MAKKAMSKKPARAKHRAWAKEDVAALKQHSRQKTPVTQIARVFPMRSAWWLPPFALALAGEWWLRRRRGLA